MAITGSGTPLLALTRAHTWGLCKRVPVNGARRPSRDRGPGSEPRSEGAVASPDAAHLVGCSGRGRLRSEPRILPYHASAESPSCRGEGGGKGGCFPRAAPEEAPWIPRPPSCSCPVPARRVPAETGKHSGLLAALSPPPLPVSNTTFTMRFPDASIPGGPSLHGPRGPEELPSELKTKCRWFVL